MSKPRWEAVMEQVIFCICLVGGIMMIFSFCGHIWMEVWK